MALSTLGRCRVILMIVPPSSSQTLIVLQDMRSNLDLLLNYCLIVRQLMQNALKTIPNKIDKSILVTTDKSWFSLIWLHGLGDSSAGFLDFFSHKASPVFQGARVKLLHAPIKPVTINGGATCPSWYDIKVLNGGGTQSQRYSLDEVKESLQIIDKNISDEIQYWKQLGIKEDDAAICKRIFIGGFSQGCAMSLCYALSSQRLLGGVIGFSGHLIESFGHKNKDKLPMLVYHGDEDDVLQYQRVKPQYAKHLHGLPNFTFKLIQGLPHSVLIQQLSESTTWMLSQLKNSNIQP